MTTNEPAATALLITTWGILLAASVLFGRVSQRAGVPVALLFILVGILAGTEGIGGIPFEDYHFAFRIGYFALALILFDGGLNTPMDAVRRYWAPAGVLATVGVVVTAGLVALCARLMGLGWPESMILGAVVSSTDAAAVFSILRGSGLHLKRRVGVTLELESGLNDPVAVILTTTLTANLMASESVDGWQVAGEMLVQLARRRGRRAGHRLGGQGRPQEAPAGERWPLPGPHPRHRVPRVRRGHPDPRQRIPRGLSRRAGARQQRAALQGGTAPGARRARLAVADRDVPDPRPAGLPQQTDGSGARRTRHRAASRLRPPPGDGRALPGSLPVSGQGDRLHRVGRPPGRGADRPGHLPDAGQRPGRGAHLQPRVLPRRGERADPGRHGGAG